MCGFITYIRGQKSEDCFDTKKMFVNMTNIITHRGPDDVGYYFDDYVYFGFRRLSIIDVEHGRQPLSYENERYWIVFNGEVYNYRELQQELKEQGLSFETNSDTEVILALFSHIGVDAFQRLRGMFSFVIWDKQEKITYAVRDPFGIKPLYYYQEEENIYLASEKKSILLAIENDTVNCEAIHHYLTYQYVPEPLTMSNDIVKLLPGTYMKKELGKPIELKQYWAASFKRTPNQTSNVNILDTLRDSVQIHMRSDVPVGAFLSGGVDSTCIVALAKEVNPNIKTFTVGFERNGYSEIDVAKETAEKLQVENIEYKITPDEFLRELPKIIWHMDDPVADPASIPLYFVAKEASKHVKVVLSGEGADELFGGYGIYKEPLSLRPFMYIPDRTKRVLKALANVLPETVKGKGFIERGCTQLEDRYIGNAKIFNDIDKALLLHEYNTNFNYRLVTEGYYKQWKDYDDVTKMQMIDIHTWLRGDILVKADRMTMAHSLELRVPFLDKEVFEVASNLQSHMNVSKAQTKIALRKAIQSIIPDHVIERRKLGFPVPIRHWLQDELYDWARQLIIESETDYLFNKHYILTLLDNHQKLHFGDQQNKLKAKVDYSRHLWTVLTFMLWHKIYVENAFEPSFLQTSTDTVEKSPIV
ncbi:asparagine synthase (glutamine-hydrolyzing) [Bacillus alkalicellulosilyticus]|uniref:asparagine synthase (glutamine-hydrolyzing) n=1 Tax=Alkalihalobacterium alkalicellulosilyticum TaxID=1912214 RepID=UPI000997D4D5|nr:asparagine synthase (glutamine-hydrolyzing) [Bacillus alkalicellulosilyticus]